MLQLRGKFPWLLSLKFVKHPSELIWFIFSGIFSHKLLIPGLEIIWGINIALDAKLESDFDFSVLVLWYHTAQTGTILNETCCFW